MCTENRNRNRNRNCIRNRNQRDPMWYVTFQVEPKESWFYKVTKYTEDCANAVLMEIVCTLKLELECEIDNEGRAKGLFNVKCRGINYNKPAVNVLFVKLTTREKYKTFPVLKTKL